MSLNLRGQSPFSSLRGQSPFRSQIYMIYMFHTTLKEGFDNCLDSQRM